MIRSLPIALAALWLAPAHAQDEAPDPAEDEAPDDDELAPHRQRFNALADRAIGTTSTPVEFNWRDSKVQLAATGSYLVELNNFNSMRGGAAVRLPTGGIMIEIGASYAGVWDSPSSRLLALTPYRQPGRPDRAELDLTFGLPLAEGVVTTFPRFFPAVELVFNAYAGFRYRLYPSGFANMTVGEVTGAVFSPILTEDEIANLDDNRLDAMQVDLGRYGLVVGFGNDIYFKSGFFVTPRLLIALPLLAPATQTDLLVWSDLSLQLGFAF